jgi:membrane fusion protein (multidrug efflux system)
MILMLTLAAAAIGGLGFEKVRQIQLGMAQAAAFQPPPEAVTTIVARQEKWSSTLNAIGTLAAVQGVSVSARSGLSYRPPSPHVIWRISISKD